jgi:hypothetical protein
MKITKDNLPPLPNSKFVGLEYLRASDNARHFRLLKQFVRDGVALNGSLRNKDNIPDIRAWVEDKLLSVWMFPTLERFVLKYLLTGDNHGYPTYPPDGRLPEFRAGDDYIDRHIKRELERGKFTHKEETQDGIDGIRFIGRYPYGSIDYGFHPGTLEELTARLENVEPFTFICDECDIPELHNANLPSEYRDLAEGARLDSVFPDGFIPSNTIIDKTICGCGATWLEIHSKRNSIIIEPNVPVIIGKMLKHPQIIGVHGDTIKPADIAEKIAEQRGYIKIMTTPDSYWKVEKALKSLREPYFNNYFMLFDECEKIVSDIDYRPNLALPIDDFFRFRGKAMVSATPIFINDPRFEQQGFKTIKIKPLYDHRRLLELKPTNNVNAMVKRTLERLDKDSVVCFFYNSVEGIEELIAFLGIVEQSNIYCSTDAKKRLQKDYPNVSDLVTDREGKTALNKYNFFTSRFYSAVDIELDYKPVIIMVTQAYKTTNGQTPHSLIDPETEAVQIAGRFRNGVERFIHITNTNVNLDYLSREDLGQFLGEQHEGLHKLLNLLREAKTAGEKHIINQAIGRTDYKSQGYATAENKENYFRWNNAYLDERLKMLYNLPASLYKAYRRSGAFTVVSEAEYAIYTDEERQKLKNGTKAERIKLLNEIIQRDCGFVGSYDYQLKQELVQEYYSEIEALLTIGHARIKALGYVDSAINAEVYRFKLDAKAETDNVKQAIYEAFAENTWYETSYVNENIHRIFTDNGIECKSIGLGKHLERYFRVEERRRRAGRGWMVYEKLAE